MANTFLQASWRGVPFQVAEHSLEGGRRTATHEFPQRDVPYTEDLGRRAKTFTLEAFVLGDNQGALRDALLNALDQEGPGVLVHPFLGTLRLQLDRFTIHESGSEVRLASFSLTFSQVGKLLFPTAASNPTAAVAAKSTQLTIQTANRAAAIKTAGQPEAVSDSATSITADVAAAVQDSGNKSARPNASALKLAEQGLTVLDQMKKASAFARDCNALLTMVSHPDVLAFALSDVIFRISDLGMLPLEAYVTYKRLFANVKSVFDALHFTSTSQGLSMSGNAGLLKEMSLTAVVGAASLAAVGADFETYGQAVQTRSELSDMFDAAMADVTDDALFQGLLDMRTATLTAIPNPDIALKNVVTVPVLIPLPTICLAYDLMNGSADEHTIIARNKVRNPWFAPNSMADGFVEILR